MSAHARLAALAVLACAPLAAVHANDAGPLKGIEVWDCDADGAGWYSDGRCYAPVGTCNPTGAHRQDSKCAPGREKRPSCVCPKDDTSPDGEGLGLGLLYFKGKGYHVVTADLSSPDVEAHVSAPHDSSKANMRTVRRHGEEADAAAAINGNFFGGDLNVPCGPARGAGKQYKDTYREAANCVTTLGWSRGAAEIFMSEWHETDEDFMPEYADLVTGGGYLLKGGERHDWNHEKLGEGRDCTAIGVSADRRRLLFVVTNDNACTGTGLQDVLLAHGAADAIHLDGGGSSKLWIRGKGYVNAESEDREPSVGIYLRPRR